MEAQFGRLMSSESGGSGGSGGMEKKPPPTPIVVPATDAGDGAFSQAELGQTELRPKAGRCILTPGWTRVDRAWFQRLKLNLDEPLSNFAFKFNLRRYTTDTPTPTPTAADVDVHLEQMLSAALTDPDAGSSLTSPSATRGRQRSPSFTSSALRVPPSPRTSSSVIGSSTPLPPYSLVHTVGPHTYCYRPISVYRLGKMLIQSCGQSVSASRVKAGATLNAHTELRAKRQRSAREATYRNRPIAHHVIGCH